VQPGATPAATSAPSGVAAPSDPAAASAASATPSAATGPLLGNDLLIADRGNGRLLIVDQRGRTVWQFPVSGSLPPGRRFAADDAFLAPDGRTIVANEESNQDVVRIDIATRRIVWSYGHYRARGRGAGYLSNPDDAYPLANGNVVVADILNCRVVEIAPDHAIVRQWGHTGVCRHDPPYSYDRPNGDTPLPDGGLLITEIGGSRVIRLDANGNVLFDVRTPAVYPSDAHVDAAGNIVVADYNRHGAVLGLTPAGRLLWRLGTAHGSLRFDRPSLAIALPNGNVLLNDDFRNRVVVVDPRTHRLVWQYGRPDQAGSASGHLSIPDGVDLIPASTVSVAGAANAASTAVAVSGAGLTEAPGPSLGQGAGEWGVIRASSYGIDDGLLGSRLACRGTLTSTIHAIALPHLPCGTLVRFRLGSRVADARVLDRRPMPAGIGVYLAPGVCRALGNCSGDVRLDWQVVLVPAAAIGRVTGSDAAGPVQAAATASLGESVALPLTVS
jgi:outer membrane protein assembly factor BamB